MVRNYSVIVAIAVILSACSPPQQQQMTPMAGFIEVKEQPVQLTSELPGRTDPTAVSEVRPQVSGIIKARLFTEGSTVKVGQPLYQIDPAPYQAAYDSASATLASAKVKATRYAALLQANAISPQDNDDAQAAFKLAAANTEAARINLAYTHIVASIAGRIGASSVTEGALVTAGQATSLATISTLDPIYVDIDQSSSELLALERAAQKGQINREGPLSAEVTLTLDDGSVYPLKGKLQFTDVTVDPTTGTVRLRALFPNPDNFLLPGLYVRATINEGVDPHGILVPQLAVSRNPKGEPIVLVVDADNMARLRMIKTGRAVDGNWQVTEGLKAGDKVIVQGLQNIRPDMKVNAMPAQTGPAPGAAPAAQPAAQPGAKK
ncbi:MAG: efflux RND transporter periplasmic adaptor subunit [Alphaproteobacteria bacterium]|nr:efflux RND transporter periplasmic adaptor subunit [Alphaproteobacteria bacterium]